MTIQNKALYLEGFVWREERGRETGRTCPSDSGNSGTARPLQVSLLSMHMMHFSSEHKSREKLQSSAGSCLVTCTSAGQLCLLHQSIGDRWRSCGRVVTEREMQTFPIEENKSETRCVSYCSEIAMLCNHQWINIKISSLWSKIEKLCRNTYDTAAVTLRYKAFVHSKYRCKSLENKLFWCYPTTSETWCSHTMLA